MFELPTISDSGLRSLSVCAHIELKGRKRTLRDWFSKNEDRQLAKVDANVYVRRIVEFDEEDDLAHFHLEAFFASTEPPASALASLKTAIAAESHLDGLKFDVTTSGTVRIPRADLPQKSIISLLLSVSTSVSGRGLKVRKCTFDVEGDGPVTLIECQSGRDSTILAEIWAREDEKEISENSLVDGAKLIGSAVDLLILERSPAKLRVRKRSK
jgi:hypothetical protein